MNKSEYLGARLEKSIVEMVEKTAEEEHVDKTQALMKLIILGRNQFLVNKYLNLYKEGKCSIDRAAEELGITVTEMMQEAVKANIKSTETIEEYKQGLKLLK